jgi:hypothetical protein
LRSKYNCTGRSKNIKSHSINIGWLFCFHLFVKLSLLGLYTLGLPRSWARSPITFSLMKKQQKIKSYGMLLAAQALCAANQIKPKARSFCP